MRMTVFILTAENVMDDIFSLSLNTCVFTFKCRQIRIRGNIPKKIKGEE